MHNTQLQPHDPEHTSYVLFSRLKNDDVEVILFVEEADNVADIEERKALFNQAKPADVPDAVVGISRFHPHPDDNKKDFIVITPRDGSAVFTWSDMIDTDELIKLANERGL